MKVSQLLHVLEKDADIVIDDYGAPVDSTTIYEGTARGIVRDNPINKMHVECIFACNDTLFVLASKPDKKGQGRQ